jgi:hypothetical protein
MHCAIVFVKNESTNLIFMATTLCFIVDYHPLKLQQVYEGTCFGHVIYETCFQLLQMMTRLLHNSNMSTCEELLWTGLQTSGELQDKTRVLLIHQLVLVYWRAVPQTISFYNHEPY